MTSCLHKDAHCHDFNKCKSIWKKRKEGLNVRYNLEARCTFRCKDIVRSYKKIHFCCNSSKRHKSSNYAEMMLFDCVEFKTIWGEEVSNFVNKVSWNNIEPNWQNDTTIIWYKFTFPNTMPMYFAFTKKKD